VQSDHVDDLSVDWDRMAVLVRQRNSLHSFLVAGDAELAIEL